MIRTFRILCILILAEIVFSAVNATVNAEDFPVRAPAVLPGTTVEMISPGFWIDKIDDPDRVIIPPASIEDFNRKNAFRVIEADHPYAKNIARIEKDGPVFNLMNPLGIGDNYPGAAVKKRLEENIDRLKKTTLYDRWVLPFTEEKKAGIIESMNLDSIPESIRPKKGIIVRHTSARLYPSAEPGYRMRNYLDDINVTSLDIGMPLAVLHMSKKRDYLFVMSPVAWGWIPASDAAYGSSEEIRGFIKADDFIVVTGHTLPLYADDSFSIHTGNLYMGERLPLVGKDNGGYIVTVPVRGFDGELLFENGRIGKGEAVHEGWLPFTKRNVITTAFRLLGRPYGWHDSWNERDCGGIMRVIFGCFGIKLPRYWSFQQLCSDHAAFVGDIEDIEEKNRILCSMPPGITFTGTTGHIVLYLGNVDGKPYGIHECGWNYNRDGTEYKMARVVVSDYENVGFKMSALNFFTPVMP